MNIVEKLNPIFRPQNKKTEKPMDTVFSAEEKQERGLGENIIRLFDQESGETVGQISFDYKTETSGEMIKISLAATTPDYRGQDLGMKLYQRVLEIAKEKKLAGVESDSVVQGGALAIWKKLQEEGYHFSVHPQLKKEYEEFCQTYDKGELFKKTLAVSEDESVFTISLKS